MTKCELLKKGREVMASKDLTKGWFYRDADGRDCNDPEKITSCCTIGALRIAAGYTPAAGEDGFSAVRDVEGFGEAKRAIEVALREFSITNWNDRPERTKEEVLAVFDLAIKESTCE